jgi:hypothetical protein
MALLGAAMGAEQAHQYRQNNTLLIPIALQRLKALHVGFDFFNKIGFLVSSGRND